MPKKPNELDKDLSFRDAVRGVKPLSHSKVPLDVKPSQKPPPLVKNITKERDVINEFSDHESLPPVDATDLLSFARPGLQHKILRNLRNGKYNIEAILDLHGMSVIEAGEALSFFLKECQRENIHHILLIHGKGHGGKPVLKNKINNWLRQSPQVLAFCSATVKHGRGGSVYVLLKGGS